MTNDTAVATPESVAPHTEDQPVTDASTVPAPPKERPPVAGYAALTTIYSAAVASSAIALKRSGRLPRSIAPQDLVLLGIGTFKVSRLISRDSVTSFLRAPFVDYQGPAPAAAELKEKPKGSGIRKAIGELLTCPFCLDQWVATGFILTFLAAPRFARTVASGFAVVTVADASQYAYRLVQKTDEG